MTRRGLGMASALMVVVMLAAAYSIGSGMPDDARLPTHWGLDGKPDAFSDKWTTLLLPAALTAGVSILFYFLPALEPRREGLARSQGLYSWGWAALLLIGAAIELLTVSTALGWDIPTFHLLNGAIGLMLVLIGNQLGKSRSMYMMGIRTPWTLASEEVWIKTHRFGGKLMVLAGAIVIAAALLRIASDSLALVVIVAVAIAAIVPTVYSFLSWRRESSAQHRSS